MDAVGLPALLEAIRYKHGCDATLVASVPVSETFEDGTVWKGEAQVFDLHGHPAARRCYAWSYAAENGRRRCAVVLETPSVRGAIDAVRARRDARPDTSGNEQRRAPPRVSLGILTRP